MGEPINGLGEDMCGHGKTIAEPVNPLDLFQGSVSEREFICDQLEAIADVLPRRACINRILSAMQFLRLKLPAYHRDERDCLFPLLKRCAPQSFGLGPILAQLQNCQVDDEDYALEVADLLEQISGNETVANADTAGYMLRGFFQVYRRYLAWQKLTILPMAASAFGADDLEELYSTIHWTRRSAGPPTLYLLPTGTKNILN
jgi:hypothetical protein